VGILAVVVFLGLMLAVMLPTYSPPPTSTCHTPETVMVCRPNYLPPIPGDN
jgi:hypothetical protein